MIPQPQRNPVKVPPFRPPVPTPNHGDDDDDEWTPTRPPDEEPLQ